MDLAVLLLITIIYLNIMYVYLSHFSDTFFSTTPNYLMKVDDDTFVNLPLLYRQLKNDEKYKNVKNLLMGNCFCNKPHRLKVIHCYLYKHL